MYPIQALMETTRVIKDSGRGCEDMTHTADDYHKVGERKGRLDFRLPEAFWRLCVCASTLSCTRVPGWGVVVVGFPILGRIVFVIHAGIFLFAIVIGFRGRGS